MAVSVDTKKDTIEFVQAENLFHPQLLLPAFFCHWQAKSHAVLCKSFWITYTQNTTDHMKVKLESAWASTA